MRPDPPLCMLASRPRDAFQGATAQQQLGEGFSGSALCGAAAAALSADAPSLEDTYYAAELLTLAGCVTSVSLPPHTLHFHCPVGKLAPGYPQKVDMHM